LSTASNRPVRSDPAYLFHYPRKFLWSDGKLPSMQWQTLDLYLHVPFCRSICTYCTFERRLFEPAAMDRFCNALSQELLLRVEHDDFSRAKIRAIYLGGGTASLMPTDRLAAFLDACRGRIGLPTEPECTLECEPATKRRDDFQRLRQHGLNRVSVGAQSLDDELLRRLNRAHSARHTLAMIDDALQAGVRTVHVDLMFGLPGQTLQSWIKDLQAVAALGVQHVSAYQLIVFEKELLSRRLTKGAEQPLPDEEVVAEMRAAADDILGRAGLPRYSLTEYARKGHQCAYVRGNWVGDDYLGFGAAAYSRRDRWLWENEVTVAGYCAAIEASRLPVRGTHMSPFQRALRDFSMGLCFFKLTWSSIERGLDAAERAAIRDIAKALEEERYLVLDDTHIRVTELGKRYATQAMNEVIQRGERLCELQPC
jgi:oxygen-independent coproporphyrinogen III oxidase